MLRTDDLDYQLPADLIATRPAEPRDACRLMVVSRSNPSRIEHRAFADLPGLLALGDTLVFNTTTVLPARIFARRADTGGKAEGLFIGTEPDGRWRLMLRAGGRLRDGIRLALIPAAMSADDDGAPSPFTLTLRGRDGEYFLADAHVAPQGHDSTPPRAAEILRTIGATPLPPYIVKARESRGALFSDDLDRAWYQNIYADPSRAGSVAAPTAGMHFTPELLNTLHARGIGRADLVLHVGPGTFKPIETEFVEQHPMHEEWFEVPVTTLRALTEHRAAGGAAHRVIAVGTTSARALESLPAPDQVASTQELVAGSTRLLITPGFQYRWIDGLITNFHLPRSTLLGLVAALFPEGVPRLLDLYALAVRERYRFYSYGDAMLILP